MPGGVCAVLDYDVDLMADYVSEMATRIVMPANSVNAAFRKFVSQILTSTRLPRTTILLGMNYLSKRVNMMHSAGQHSQSEGQIWRMLTIALLLGSKFLDDNTFQNKSWSEVSGIDVRELNTLENEWLSAISWGLYVNLDESKDYNAWLANWQEWLETKKRQQAQAARDRLVPPIITDVGRNIEYYSWHQQQVAELERYSSMKRQAPASSTYGRDSALGWNMHWQQSAPPTPPDSGYGTPEYKYNSGVHGSDHGFDHFDRAMANNVNRLPTPPYPAYPHVYQPTHPPSYRPFNTYPQGIWDRPHNADCRCAVCTSAYARSMAYAPFAPFGQSVMG